MVGASLGVCSATAQTPVVAAVEPVYDFGAVKQGARIQHDFKLRNAGDASLRISAAELSAPGIRGARGAGGDAPWSRGDRDDRMGH